MAEFTKHDILTLIGTAMVLVIIIVAIATVDSQRPTASRVDVISRGPYIVERDGKFLAWENRGTFGRPDWQMTWSDDVATAWRYVTPGSAESDVTDLGGQVRPLREVID